MKLLSILLLAAVAASAQTTLYVGAGPGGYLAKPYAAFDATFGIGDSTGTNASYTTVELRGGTLQDPSTVKKSVRTGYRRVIATTGNVSLFTLALGGVASTENVTAAAFSGGGGLTYNPKLARAPGLRFSAVVQALGALGSIGWAPMLTLQCGYVFSRGQ